MRKGELSSQGNAQKTETFEFHYSISNYPYFALRLKFRRNHLIYNIGAPRQKQFQVS